MKRRVYLDSCVVIYLIEGEEVLSRAVRSALQSDFGFGIEACVSPLTRLECRVRPLREDQPELLRHYDRFFSSRGLRWGRLTRGVMDLATSLRARHRIKTPDAIHLAVAATLGSDEFWTNDHRLSSGLDLRLSIRQLP